MSPSDKEHICLTHKDLFVKLIEAGETSWAYKKVVATEALKRLIKEKGCYHKKKTLTPLLHVTNYSLSNETNLTKASNEIVLLSLPSISIMRSTILPQPDLRPGCYFITNPI